MKFNTDVNVLSQDSGVPLIHLPIRGYAFEATDDEARIISKINNQELLKDEEKNHLIVKKLKKINAFGIEKNIPLTKKLESFSSTEATLIFTETCNLGCTYCYASSLPEKSEVMSIEMAKAAIDEVVRNAKIHRDKLVSVRLIGGGEPTIEWELLKWTCGYANEESKKHGLKCFIRLITNGTLLREERVVWLADNVDFVTLSFDILPELQNNNRPYAGGKESQTTLLKTISLFGKYGVEFHLRTTISAEGSGRLSEMVKYTAENTCAKSVRFEPMAEIGRSVQGTEIIPLSPKISGKLDSSITDVSELTKPPQQIFIDSFKEAYFLGKELGIDVTCKMFGNHKRRNTRFCNAEFSVSPNGSVSACHRYSREEHEGFNFFKIGQYNEKNNNFDIDVDNVNEIRLVDNNSFEDCKTCFARWSCASGCLSARYSSKGINQNGPLCHLTRELLIFGISEELKIKPEKSHERN